jgi:high-affinity nickel-transport protein
MTKLVHASNEHRSLIAVAGAVLVLHVTGFLTLLALTSPGHGLRAAGTLTLGVGLTAYVLGLRHAFDADHIAAIDNTTRKLMADGKRPVSVGFWFSLGHSTIVFALTAAIALGIRTLDGPVERPGSSLHTATSLIGTIASGGFLYLIAALNFVILVGIVRVVREMRQGRYDERSLERQLEHRGLMNRLLARFTRAVKRPIQMYPIGVLFGLGFDTATEVALIVLAAGAAGAGLPWYAILCLPTLFAAGMSLMDTLDGVLMSRAYDWAFSAPVRRVFYNLVVTGLSVAVAVLIGTIELGGLLAAKLDLRGPFWTSIEAININTLGYAVVATFLLTWVLAVSFWRFGHVEQRWASTLAERD